MNQRAMGLTARIKGRADTRPVAHLLNDVGEGVVLVVE